MQSGKYHVTGQGGLDSDFCGFLVAHFTNHYDVRVGAEKCPHCCSEGEADLWCNLKLTQSPLLDFYGVLCSPDFAIRCIQITENGVQRSGFTGSGRAAHKEQ